jgi:hypothetical protein
MDAHAQANTHIHARARAFLPASNVLLNYHQVLIVAVWSEMPELTCACIELDAYPLKRAVTIPVTVTRAFDRLLDT